MGTGSTFWFTARFEQDTSAETPPVWLPDDLRGLSVLVVDDNPTSRDILRRTFESWDTAVEAIASDDPLLNSSKDGWSGSQVFDLVVIDLPVVDDAVSSPSNQAIQWAASVASKLLILTPVNSEFTPNELEAAVSYRCLRKPPSPSELLNAVTDLFCSVEDQQAMRQQTQTPSQQAAASEWPNLTGRVLLAEDHPTNQMYVCELLRRAGLEVEVASNGREAVEAVANAAGTELAFDVVLMDCQMPEMDGFAATRAIRKAEESREAAERIPIVALTANAIKGDRELCLDSGMDDYLSKPVEAMALLETVEKYTRSDRSKEPHPSPTPKPEEGNTAELLTESPERTPPLDIQTALTRCMGDADFLAATLDSFAVETPKYIEELVRVVAQQDSDATRKAAHSIKGAAGMITAEGLRAVAEQLEESGRDGRIEEAAEQLKQLCEEAERCFRYVETVRQAESTEGTITNTQEEGR